MHRVCRRISEQYQFHAMHRDYPMELLRLLELIQSIDWRIDRSKRMIEDDLGGGEHDLLFLSYEHWPLMK